MPDIFDQIHVEVSGQSAPPQGDIFDQIHAQAMAQSQTAEQFLNTKHAGLNAQERANMDYQRAHPAGPPPASGQVVLPPHDAVPFYGAMPQSYAGLPPGQSPGAIRNAATAFMHGGESLGNFGIQALGKAGAISPEREQQLLDTQVFTPEPNRMSATIGQGLSPLMAGPAAPMAMAIQGAEHSREQIEQLQQAGIHPTLIQQYLNTYGQAGLNYLMGKAMPGQKLSGMLMRGVPLAGRLAMAPVIGKMEAEAGNTAGNVVSRLTVNPNQNLTEGNEEAGMAGMALGVGGQIAHEAVGARPQPAQRPRLSEMRERAAAAAEPITKASEPNPVIKELFADAAAHKQAADTGGELGPIERRYAPRTPSTPENEAQYAMLRRMAAEKVGDNLTENERAQLTKRPTPPPTAEPAVPAARPPEAAGGNGEVRGGAGRDAEESGILAKAQEIANLRGRDERGELSGQEKANAAKMIDEGVNAEVEAHGKKYGEDANDDLMERIAAIKEQKPSGVTEKVEPIQPAPLAPEGKPNLLEDMKARNGGAKEKGNPRLVGGRRAGSVAVPEAANKLFERDINPTLEKTGGAIKKSWDALNRFAGTGLNLKARHEDTAMAIRRMEGERQVHQARLETATKPALDAFGKMLLEKQAQWADHFEESGESMVDDRALKDYAKLRTENNEKLIDRAAKVGLNAKAKGEPGHFEGDEYVQNENLKGWNINWFGRSVQGREGAPTGGQKTLTGPEGFRKARVFDTAQEMVEWAKEKGIELPFRNMGEAALWKDFQVNRSVESRELMYERENAKQLRFVPDGERPPETHDTKLNDPLAKQERDVIAPKWMVARLLNMPHADAEAYLRSPQWKKNSQVLRPGDDVPKGFSKSGEKVRGQLMADSNTAGLFNNLISPGFQKDVPVVQQIANARRLATGSVLFLPAAHGTLLTVGNFAKQIGLAGEAARFGQWGNALESVRRALNPARSFAVGKAAHEQAANPEAHPELEQTVQTMTRGGKSFDLKSVLDRSSFENAKTEWGKGNKAGAGVRLAKFVYDKIESPVFNHMGPNLKASAEAMAAKIGMDRGLEGRELDEFMTRHNDDVNNLMGLVKRSHQFQNKILTDAMDVIADAPKFVEGTARFVGAFGRDTVKAIKELATGQGLNLRPAHYTALAGLLSHMTGAALTQMVWSKIATGKVQLPTSLEDYFKPRTGKKDEKGRDERVSILSPFSPLFSAAERGVGSLTGHVAHLWKTAEAEISGQDQRGRSIEGQRLKFAAKQMTPLPIQAALGMNEENHKMSAGERVAGTLGAHFSYDYESKAANAAQKAIYAKRGAAPIAPEQSEKMDAESRLRQEIQGKQPNAQGDIAAAVQQGKLTPKDAAAVRKHKPEGLAGLLKSSELDARTIMKDVWPKMSAQEKQRFRLQTRMKIGRANMPQKDKEDLWKQMDQ